MREMRELTTDAGGATGGGPEGPTAPDSGSGFGLHDPAQRPSGMTCVRANRRPRPGFPWPDAPAGRSRARFYLLPALALLLGALGLLAAAPVQAQVLGVDATPACGTRVTDTSVQPTWAFTLTPAPDAEVETEYRWVTDTTSGPWSGGALSIKPSGRSVEIPRDNTFAQLRQAFPGFAGFEFRLKYTPAVTAQCAWQFDDDGGGTPPTVRLTTSPNPVTEGSPVTVTAWLSSALESAVTIPLTLTAGTAGPGDYDTLASITIAGGSMAGTGTISTTRDADTNDETFTVALGTLPAEVRSGSPSSVEVTIRYDDGGGTTCSTTDAAVVGIQGSMPSDPAARAADCSAMLRIKDTLRGTAALNWARTVDMFDWDGVILSDEDGDLSTGNDKNRVAELRLISKSLDGTIPSGLSALTGLTHLHLVGNELTGRIPDLSALTSLIWMELQQNKLSGSIPSTLNGFTSLTVLNLGENELTGGIPNLSGLTNLAQLHLYQNELTGTIPDLSALTSLTHLSLFQNKLKGSIPSTLNSLTSLTNLSLSQNELTGSIPDLSALASLTGLFLQQNQLSGSIDASLFPASLTDLYLQQNGLTGRIPDLSALTSLQKLYLYDNELTGSIDASFFPTSLQRLLLHINKLTGDIPDLSALTSLQQLWLYDNELTGSIDASFFPTSLQWLFLHRNELTGDIPDLSALSNLTLLWLHQNELTGAIPSSLGSLTSLQQLHLADNNFSGGIPSELGALTALSHLSLCEAGLDAAATLPSALDSRRTAGSLTVWPCVRIEDAAADEGQELSFDVTHSTWPVRGGGSLTLSYATRDGTARSADYAAVADGTVTVPAIPGSETSATTAITVAAAADGVLESAETFTVTLRSRTAIGVRLTAVGTIRNVGGTGPRRPPPPPDDDPGDDDDGGSGTTPAVSLSASPNPVDEGSAVTVTATLTAALSADVTIPLTLTAGTAEEGDYASLSDITITAGQTAGTGTITTEQDTDADDETFTVALGTLPSSVTAGTPSSVEITITDDEKPSVLLSASPNPVDEGSAVTLTATLTAALSTDVTIPLTLTAGTADAGDYASLSDITITAGQTAGTGTIATEQDTDADDETFTVALGTLPAAVTAGTPSSVEITITDDEKPSVSLDASPNPVTEGEVVTITATLTAALSADVTIPLTLTHGTAEDGDYDTLASITVTAGQTAGTGTIATEQDTDADDETFTVELGTLPSPVTAGTPSSVEITITDDEKPSVSLSASPNPVDEGSTVTVTATLTAALSADVTIPLTLTHGTAEDGDHGTLASITVTAGQTAGTGTVSTTQDEDRDDETFTVALGTLPPAVTEGSPSSLEVTIRDTTAAQSRLFVPIVLQSAGRTGGSFFTSEMILTNRGPATAAIGYTYRAAYGGGSGKAVDSLGAGEQRVIADAIAYLTALGVPVGSSPAGGTLRVDFSNLSLASDAAVTLRVTTPVEEGGGRAGLSYYGLDPAGLLTGPAFITGLRQNERDRSNLAIQNAGVSGEETITLRVTVFSGDPAAPARSLVLPDRTLPPGGFYQYNGILDLAGFDNGYVKVEPVGGTAPFYCYGVINDNFNSDGAFVFPVPESSLVGRAGQTLPVIIESGNFRSELTVTNVSASGKTVDFRFVADAVDSSDDTARFSLTLEAGEQVILPDIVEELRRHGVEGIGPADRPFMGALFATPAEGDMGGIVIGARTGSPDGRGGQYSLFYDGVPYGSAFTGSVWIYGLQQDGENRSNLALVNTGEIDDSSSTFELTIYDGSGAAPPRIRSMTLGPRRWTQANGILGDIGQGYVQVRKTSGNNPFFAYGVINDGGAPGERSGDGAYLPARE